jgi:hypothetical protein
MIPIRCAIIAYIISASWLFGWLTATFGLLRALVAGVILGLPSFFAWRMTVSKRPVKRREYGYLGVLTTFALVGTVLLIDILYGSGVDKVTIFERECRAFRRHIAEMPEFMNIDVTYIHNKVSCVRLHGAVATKTSHDQLMQSFLREVRYWDVYDDDVDYPGKLEADVEKRIKDRGSLGYPGKLDADKSLPALPRNSQDKQFQVPESAAGPDSNESPSPPAK